MKRIFRAILTPYRHGRAQAREITYLRNTLSAHIDTAEKRVKVLHDANKALTYQFEQNILEKQAIIKELQADALEHNVQMKHTVPASNFKDDELEKAYRTIKMQKTIIGETREALKIEQQRCASLVEKVKVKGQGGAGDHNYPGEGTSYQE